MHQLSTVIINTLLLKFRAKTLQLAIGFRARGVIILYAVLTLCTALGTTSCKLLTAAAVDRAYTLPTHSVKPTTQLSVTLPTALMDDGRQPAVPLRVTTNK